MSRHHRSVRIIDAPPDTDTWTSLRRARKAVRLEVAVWVEEGVSMRLVAVSAQIHRPVLVEPTRPAPRWFACWRTCEAAVLQPYQPFQRGVA